MASTVKTILELVPLGGSIKTDCFIDELAESLKASIQKQQNWTEKKYNIDFLLWVAILIENVFKDAKKLKVDKKDILLKLFEKIFGILTDADKRTITANLENLHTNKQIIKISKNWFKRKLNKTVFGKK
jgi:hypothetical protein